MARENLQPSVNNYPTISFPIESLVRVLHARDDMMNVDLNNFDFYGRETFEAKKIEEPS